MIKIIIQLICTFVLLAFATGVKVNFNPFVIKFTNLQFLFGVLLVAFGIGLLINANNDRYFLRGWSKCLDHLESNYDLVEKEEVNNE